MLSRRGCWKGIMWQSTPTGANWKPWVFKNLSCSAFATESAATDLAWPCSSSFPWASTGVTKHQPANLLKTLATQYKARHALGISWRFYEMLTHFGHFEKKWCKWYSFLNPDLEFFGHCAFGRQLAFQRVGSSLHFPKGFLTPSETTARICTEMDASHVWMPNAILAS